MSNLQSVRYLILIVSAFGVTGCASVDRMTSKLDMAGAHLEEPHQHEFEGRLEAVKTIGSMTSLQFSGSKFYDVSKAPPGLVPGDTVRIYKTETGYEARLWKAAPVEPIISSEPVVNNYRRGS